MAMIELFYILVHIFKPKFNRNKEFQKKFLQEYKPKQSSTVRGGPVRGTFLRKGITKAKIK